MTDMDNIIRLYEGAQAWRRRLIVSDSGAPRANAANALTAFRGAPEWSGVLAHNEFTLTVVMVKAPPWRARQTTGPRRHGRIVRTCCRRVAAAPGHQCESAGSRAGRGGGGEGHTVPPGA
jgi:hypothetical protein